MSKQMDEQTDGGQVTGAIIDENVNKIQDQSADLDQGKQIVAASFSATHLCLCVLDYSFFDPFVFSVKLLELSKLFSKDNHDGSESLADELISSTEYDPDIYGYGIAVASDRCVYVTAKDLKIRRSRITDLRGQSNSRFFKSAYNVTMDTPKRTPIVVEINKLIYVLAHPRRICSGIFDTDAFGVYDPLNCNWEHLDSPPCMTDPYHLSPITSYVAFDKYLCVSTFDMSFSFNTETRKWEACLLFSDFYETDSDETYSSVKPAYGYGPPFPFTMKALIYDDYLLCSENTCTTGVVAFKIDEGKVVGERIVIMAGTFKEDASGGYYNILVHLGGSEFCQISRDEELLYFTKFNVEKSEYGMLTRAQNDVKVSTVHIPLEIYERVHFYQAVAF